MKNSIWIRYGIASVVFFIAQILIFKETTFYRYGFSFIYLGILLLLPSGISPILSMVFAFIVGLSVDVFYDSMGIHAFSAVFMMFIRHYFMHLFSPRNETNGLMTIMNVDFFYLLIYSVVLILFHNLAFFIIENPITSVWYHTILKIIVSTLLTLFFYLAMHYLLFKERRQR